LSSGNKATLNYPVGFLVSIDAPSSTGIMHQPPPDSFLGNILIVDDQLGNLRTLTQMLTQSGYRVRAAITGKMALAVMKFSIPDAVLLDTRMPRMDGYEVCRQIKHRAALAEIPIIFMGEPEELMDLIKAFAVGGVDYVLKPFHPIEVLARLKTHITLRRLHQQLQEKNKLLEQQNQQLRQEVRDRQLAETALQIANQSLASLAHEDALTQIANRRRFDDYLHQTWQCMAQQGRSLSVLLCDIDDFKRYNDTYGHPQGDRCLHQIAQTLAQVVPLGGMVARYGGEEFAIVLPDASTWHAVQLAQQIQSAIAQLRLPHAQSEAAPYVTLSIGISSTIPQADHPAANLLHIADQALYQAKHQGRNGYCVCSASTPLHPPVCREHAPQQPTPPKLS
jgi:diguanylate cyclase (GGDEF)-like protein